MRSLLQLAAILALTSAAASHAQITNPDQLVAPAPRNPARAHAKPADDLQWLWPFTRPEPNGRAYDLLLDARFQSLLAANFKQAQAMWGPDDAHPTLAATIPLFLDKYGAVTAEGNRYIAIDGCVPSFCPAHGLLWIDTASSRMYFAAVNWTTENHATDDNADFDLWLFSNRTTESTDLPLAFTESLSHWDARLAAAHRLVPHIKRAILIQSNGAASSLEPALAGMNTLPPQPDTLTPKEADE